MKSHLKVAILALLVTSFAGALILKAHCEIPCGIYDDPMRMKMIYEDITTIAKSIHEIGHIKESAKPDLHQLTRWVINKETHANRLQETVTQYFMTQRIVPVAADDPAYPDYTAKLTALHRLLVEAMKAKQTDDPAVVARLKARAAEFEALYFKK